MTRRRKRITQARCSSRKPIAAVQKMTTPRARCGESQILYLRVETVHVEMNDDGNMFFCAHAALAHLLPG